MIKTISSRDKRVKLEDIIMNLKKNFYLGHHKEADDEDGMSEYCERNGIIV